MSMIDMKMSQDESEPSMLQSQEMSPEKPEYPCGLMISLENDQLAKLGINELPKVGSEFNFQAKGVVCRVSMQESEDGDNKCVGIQIQAIDMGEKKLSATQALYGD